MHLLRGLLVVVFTILTVGAAEEKNHSSIDLVRCPFPTQQIYSHEAKKCVSLVNGPCSINKSEKLTDCSKKENETEEKLHDHSIECIPGAFCSQAGLFGYCTCKPGLVETADRKCALTYGQSCDISSKVQCDEHLLLGCIEGKCDCANPMHAFNGYSGLCMGKVGAYCKYLSLEQETKYVPNHDYVICGYGAVCFVNVKPGSIGRFSPENEFVATRFGNGVCICNGMSGYTETENRTCKYTERNYESYHKEKSDGNAFSRVNMPGLILIISVILMMLIICFLFMSRGC